ncbi:MULTISPECIES: helix-turn-helix transcriptional regulator [unclassified Streptococcus]|uniref:helix-turn-helix domain-containing protein n=1 Tax=unclassified Streptococcus TaxID=2608887 RepID=UPI0018C982D7|nr:MULTISPECIES: helix-turn-helix transcriptional regulator [unclassified Streptococcus]MBG9367671.1 helix-turn-helix transcriptional regulator [Streptococcus sp. NLN64]MBJ6745252.1 helix-turn-helix transcriptional regulator [Streptococcus sp. 121]
MNNKKTLSQFVADRIKVLRKERGLTQEKLSESSQLDVKYVNKLENYRHSARLETLEQLLDALNVTYSEFFEFNIHAQTPELEALLEVISELPVDEQQRKINAVIELLRD